MWVSVGNVEDLKIRNRRRLFAESGKGDDLALFYIGKKFYVLDAWCGHLGGPLFDGQIEELPESCQVSCPWHGYTFNLGTGECPIGFKQNTYTSKIEDDTLFVEYHCELSTCPYVSHPAWNKEVKSTE